MTFVAESKEMSTTPRLANRDSELRPSKYAREMAWANELAGELEQHPGELVAIVDGKIAATARSVPQLLREIERLGLQQPFVVPVPQAPSTES